MRSLSFAFIFLLALPLLAEEDKLLNLFLAKPPVFTPETPPKKTSKTENYYAVLKPGSSVVSMKDNRVFLSLYPIYVHATLYEEGAETAYLADKEGEIAHYTLTKNLESLSEEFDLGSKPNFFKPVMQEKK